MSKHLYLVFLVVLFISSLAMAQEATLEPRLPLNTNLAQPLTQSDLTVLVGNVQRPNGIGWLNGKLYTACNGDWTLYEIDAISGDTVTFVFGVKNAHMLYPEVTDQGFNLWVPDFETNTLSRINQDRSAPVQVAEGLQGPWGIVPFDNDFIVSNLKDGTLTKVTREGEVSVLVQGLRSPAGLARDEEHLYFANNGSARRGIEWLAIDDLATKSVEEIVPISLVSGIQSVSNVVLGPDELLYFTYALGTRGVVGRINPSQCREAACTNEDVEIVVYTELQAPLAGLVISPEGRLYVHTIFRPELYWVDLAN